MTCRVIVHGGAGRALKDPSRAAVVREALRTVAADLHQRLCAGESAVEVVRVGCRMLEDDPNFNAGTGSVIQSDGQIRMSAGIMDGDRQSFSGVINVSRIRNPIDVAAYLQDFPDRVIAGDGTSELVREMQLPIHDPATDKRLREWAKEKETGFKKDPAAVVAEEVETDRRKGTIGVVALDSEGRIAAGTSTGGRGFERVGRVSDTATVAGNYATDSAGVSATGIGEDIVDEAFCARVVVRVEDGSSLEAAMERSIRESEERERLLGAIAIDKDGAVVWGKASPILLAAWHDGAAVGDSVGVPEQAMVVRVI